MAAKIKTKERQSSQAARLQPVPQTKPDWPPLRPLPSPLDLSLEHMTPGQIVVIRRFWTSSLCKTYVNFLSTLPLTTTPGKPRKGEAVRVNDRFQVDDPDFAARLWTETELCRLLTGEAVGSPEEQARLWGGELLGLNPNIRVYRYKEGQFFDRHYDEANNVTLPGGVKAKTTWTLLLYLTSRATGCIGGETVFYPDAPSRKTAAPDPIVADLEVGMALLHKHGRDCMLHEGREVKAGEKWVIRSDLCVGTV